MFVWLKENAIKHFKVFRRKRKKEKRWVGVSKPIECALLVGGRERAEKEGTTTHAVEKEARPADKAKPIAGNLLPVSWYRAFVPFASSSSFTVCRPLFSA
jgi:hypothetical protein